ncbi:T cell receptor delta constant isoform X2, partial [Huso huso]
LIFGSGTKLSVQPKNIPEKAPSLSVFTPPKERDTDTAVCVATGFFPKNMDISMRVGDGDPKITASNDKAVLSLTDKTYNFAAFLTVDKGTDQQVTCEANGKTEKSIKKEESANNTVYLITALVSFVFLFTESIHLNFKSLTLQGLRVMFVKTVAFNFLMTVRALMF